MLELMEDVGVCGIHVVVWMVEAEVVELVGCVIVVEVHVDLQVSPAPTERIVEDRSETFHSFSVSSCS